MADQIEATFTVKGDHSVVVVRLVDGSAGKRRTSRSRTVRLGVGRDQVAGLSLSTVLIYLSIGLKAAALQRGGDRLAAGTDSDGTPAPPGGPRGRPWTQPTLNLE